MVIGGGGHARVVIDSLVLSGVADPVAILDANRDLWGTFVYGVPVVGSDECLLEQKDRGITHFVVGVGSVRDNRPRSRLFEMGLRQGLSPLTVRHPESVCSPRAEVGFGSVLLPGSVVNAGAVLGRNVIVNTGAVVEHDCRVGDHAHIASRACLCSAVEASDYAHIGSGATVRQCLSIGTGAVVGAGAVVVADVAPWSVVMGVPAREANKREKIANLP